MLGALREGSTAELALGASCPPYAARVWGEVVRGPATTALIGVLLLAFVPGEAFAGGVGAGPGPSSQGTGALTNGQLIAGAGGTYLPVTPGDIGSSGGDPRNPLAIPPPGPNPQGMSCPETHLFHVGPGSPTPGGGVLAVISIHPGFTKNVTGGYDGYDGKFKYAVPDAIPAGGDPAWPITHAIQVGPLPEYHKAWSAAAPRSAEFTMPMDLAGVPAICVPCGFSSDGLPYSIQFTGRRLSEATLCRIAYAYERSTDWHTRHPTVLTT